MSVGGLLGGLIVGICLQLSRSSRAKCFRSMRGWCRKGRRQDGYERVVLDAGNRISDGNSTTSANEGVSDHTDASSNHSDDSVVSGAREIERREFKPFNSSADDTWQYAYKEFMYNRVQIGAPPYDFMPMTNGPVPAMHLNQAFAVPQLVTPTLYNEPNETDEDEEEILPVGLSGHKRASANDSEAKCPPLMYEF